MWRRWPSGAPRTPARLARRIWWRRSSLLALSWSGGKDCAAALAALRRAGRPPSLLLTTVDAESGRVPHHWVRRSLIAAQARAVGLPWVEIPIPPAASDVEYTDAMRAAFARAPLDAVTAVAFGDLFLEDLRAWRAERMAEAGLEAVFPVWGRHTTEPFSAVIVCVDPARLSPSFLGQAWDPARLPEGVDPCGENGEFHTFVHDGPEFSSPVPWQAGEVSERAGYPFLDLR